MDYYFADGDVQRGPFSLADLARQGLRADALVWRAGMADWQRADAVPEVRDLLPQSCNADAGAPLPEARIDALPGTPTVPLADDYPTAPAGGAYPSTGGGYGQPAYGTPRAPGYGTPAYATPGDGALPYAGPAQQFPGQPLAYSQPIGYARYGTATASSGMANASMVLGILAMPLMALYCLGLPCAIIAVILGHVARGRARRGEASGGGMALAGLICGYVSIALAVGGILLFVLFMAGAG